MSELRFVTATRHLPASVCISPFTIVSISRVSCFICRMHIILIQHVMLYVVAISPMSHGLGEIITVGMSLNAQMEKWHAHTYMYMYHTHSVAFRTQPAAALKNQGKLANLITCVTWSLSCRQFTDYDHGKTWWWWVRIFRDFFFLFSIKFLNVHVCVCDRRFSHSSCLFSSLFHVDIRCLCRTWGRTCPRTGDRRKRVRAMYKKNDIDSRVGNQ